MDFGVDQFHAAEVDQFHAAKSNDPPNALDELKSTIGKKHQFGTTALGAYFTAD